MDERWKMVTYSFHASVVGRISGEISGRSVYEARQMNFSSSIYIYNFPLLKFLCIIPYFSLFFCTLVRFKNHNGSVFIFSPRFPIVSSICDNSKGGEKTFLFFLFLEPFDTAGKGKRKIETDEIGNFIPGMENIIGGVVEYKNR